MELWQFVCLLGAALLVGWLIGDKMRGGRK